MVSAEIQKLIEEAIKQAGYETRAYTGRTMYSKKCLAIGTDDTGIKVVTRIMVAMSVLNDGTECDTEQVGKILEGGKEDTMGRGSIVYWPNLAPPIWDSEDD